MGGNRFCRTTLAILIGQALAAGAAQAATFTVTNVNDSGAGSLRQAVLDANGAPGADNIVFDPGLQGSTITLTSGEISITEDLTITGPTAGDPASISISGNFSSRILYNPAYCFYSGGPPAADLLTLENLTLTAGQSSDYQGGGAVLNCGDVVVRDSAITGNTTNGDGGGIKADYGSVTLTNTTVSSNTSSSGDGGGLSADGAVTLANSTVSNNTASDGGGISVLADYDPATVEVRLDDSTVSNNHAVAAYGDGGGIFTYGEGPYGSVVLQNSTVSGNDARYGGGIATGAATIANSTVSGNTARGEGYGGRGGGISAADVTLSNSTVTGNSAQDGSYGGSGYGGGIDSYYGTVALDNTIVGGGNTATVGPDIYASSVSGSYSLVQDPAVTVTGTGNIQGVDPLLGPLSNNGGLTLTHALLAGSPAIDAGDPAFVPPPDFDQRGSPFVRVQGGRIDIGAYETQPTGSIEFATATASFNEEAGTVGISVLRTDASVSELTATVTSASGTATQGIDFQAVNQVLTFPEGVTQQTVNVTLLDDVDCEGDETFQLNLSGASIGITSTMTVRIVDDADMAGAACRDTIAFSQADYAVGETAGDAVLVVRRQGPALGAADVSYATLDGDATSPDDFTATSGALSWPDGDTSDREIRVPIIDDVFIEGDEQFQVTLSNPVGAELDNLLATASVTILDNEMPDTEQTLLFSVGGDRVITEGESLTGSIERTGGSSGAVSVNVGTFNGDAIAGEDYQAQVTVLRWADGEEGSKSFRISTIDDTQPEGDESFVVSLTNPVNAALSADARQFTVTVRDNDVAPLGGVVRMVTPSTRAFVTEEGVDVSVRRLGGSDGVADAMLVVRPRGDDRPSAQVPVSWEEGESGVRTVTVPRRAFDVSLGDHFAVTLVGDNVAVTETSAVTDVTVVGRETVSEEASNDDGGGGGGGGGGGAMGPWSLLLMALMAPLVRRLRRRVQS